MVNLRNKNSTEASNKLPNLDVEELKILLCDIFDEKIDKLVLEIKALKGEIQELKAENIHLKNHLTIYNSNIEENEKQSSKSEPKDDFISSYNDDTSSSSESSINTSINTIVPAKQKEEKSNCGEKVVRDKKRLILKSNTFKKKNENVIIGCNNEINTNLNVNGNGFSAPEQKLWLYIGRCNPNTTAEDIHEYLAKKFPGKECDISKLSTKGTNSAFRLGMDVDLQDAIYEPSIWPRGIVVKRFHFFRAHRSNNGPGPTWST